MLRPRNAPKRSLSLSEQRSLGTLGESDYLCKLCLDEGVHSSLFCLQDDWICTTHGRVQMRIPKHAVMLQFEYERELIYKKLYGGSMNTSLTVREARELAEFNQEQVEAYLEQYRTDLYVPAEIKDPNKKKALALALAEVKVYYDLEPLSGEVAIGSFSGDNFKLIIQRQGWMKIARREAMKELGSLVNFSRPKLLSAEEIELRRAHYCYKCNGAGKFKSNNKCFACDGTGRFEPGQVIAMEVEMTVLEEAKQFMAAGLKYQPTVGLGVWQPGGNAPTSKDPRWKCEANAIKDAIRQRFSLTMRSQFGGQIQFVTEDEVEPAPRDMGEARVVSDPVTENINALIELHGLKISRPHLFEQTIRAAIAKGLFSDEADFVQVMIDHGFEFDAERLDHFKLLMASAKNGLYPLDLATGDAPLAGPEKLLFFNEVEERHGLSRGQLGQLWSQVFGRDNKILQPFAASRVEAHNFLYYLDARIKKDPDWNKKLAEEAAQLSKSGKRFGIADDEVKSGDIIDQEKADA